jgi:hypothetical protein
MQLVNNWQLDSTATDCNSTAVAWITSCQLMPGPKMNKTVDQPVATSRQLVFGSKSSNGLRAASLTFDN